MFNNLGGPIMLSEGSSIGVSVSWGTADHFAVWIMANPIGPGIFGGSSFLQVSGFAKEKHVQPPNTLVTVYHATVTNGGDTTLFNLEGGGNT